MMCTSKCHSLGNGIRSIFCFLNLIKLAMLNFYWLLQNYFILFSKATSFLLTLTSTYLIFSLNLILLYNPAHGYRWSCVITRLSFPSRWSCPFH